MTSTRKAKKREARKKLVAALTAKLKAKLKARLQAKRMAKTHKQPTVHAVRSVPVAHAAHAPVAHTAHVPIAPIAPMLSVVPTSSSLHRSQRVRQSKPSSVERNMVLTPLIQSHHSARTLRTSMKQLATVDPLEVKSARQRSQRKGHSVKVMDF